MLLKSKNHGRHHASDIGFTLVELLIVIVVIAVLATITIVAYKNVSSNARISTIKSDLAQAVHSIAVYQVDNGTFPDSVTTAGLKPSPGNTFIYQTTATGYCLMSSDGIRGYRVTNTQTSPVEGICSGVLPNGTACPTGFIVVPGNSSLGTSDFCVYKYEAKIQGQDNGQLSYLSSFVPESRASGTPWTKLSQANAIAEAPTACSGCHLVTDPEWMTIVGNALSVSSNWSGGTVGSGYVYIGHTDSLPNNALDASTDDTDGYYGTGNSAASGDNQRRTLTLTNGEVIWDIGGNVMEWVNATIGANQQPGSPSDTGPIWRQWDDSSLNMNGFPQSSRPSALASVPGLSGITGWDSNNGLGQVKSYMNDTTARAYIRGGYWDSSTTLAAGLLTLYLNHAATDTQIYIGWRIAR